MKCDYCGKYISIEEHRSNIKVKTVKCHPWDFYICHTRCLEKAKENDNSEKPTSKEPQDDV